METLFNNKKINISVFILLIVLSLFVAVKFINEVKSSSYVGRGNQPANVIAVDGKGEVTAVSDIATLQIDLNKEGKTSKEAQDLLNEQVTAVLKYLSDQKIADKDIKSEYGGLNPKYVYEPQPVCYSYPCPSREPKITGYIATQSITVKVREVDNANTIRSGLTEMGVTNMTGPTFSIDDEDGLKAEARSLAIKDAKAKAKVLADELGVRLGKVVNFSENNNGGYPMYEAKAMSLDSTVGSVPAPTLPKGENKITSNVSITYEIR